MPSEPAISLPSSIWRPATWWSETALAMVALNVPRLSIVTVSAPLTAWPPAIMPWLSSLSSSPSRLTSIADEMPDRPRTTPVAPTTTSE